MTELQYAALVISLSTLGQADITAIAPDQLRTLAFLLEEALENVRKTLEARQAARVPALRHQRAGPGPGPGEETIE